jgi:predicted MPP superfamily phosphohydrolase
MVKQAIFDELEKRLGKDHLGSRLRLQIDHSARFFGHGYGGFHWENIETIPWLLKGVLQATGFYERGLRNALNYQVIEVEVLIHSLPPEFHGLRILQLSDIHSDAWQDQGKGLLELISRLSFDVCVITGDYRFLTFGDYGGVIKSVASLITTLQCEFGVIGILGNHDFIEKVPLLESLGIRMLINESLPLQRGGSVIWLVGLDDPHFYGLHDLSKALANIPRPEVKILLVHTPEIIPAAAAAGIDYYLCGHTHGGQVCLPGGIPIVYNARCKRKYIAGSWKFNGMSGYTSRGTGSSGLPVRFFCPPEVTLHHLVAAPPG